MSLEESVMLCFEGGKEVTPECIQALVEFIRKREEHWRAQVSKLRIDLHFAHLAQEEKDARIHELEKEVDEWVRTWDEAQE